MSSSARELPFIPLMVLRKVSVSHLDIESSGIYLKTQTHFFLQKFNIAQNQIYLNISLQCISIKIINEKESWKWSLS